MRQPIFFARFCICEIFGPAGYPRTTYTYSPFGQVTASGDVTQPIQWSSEVWDSELGLVYYNWRHYNTSEGRWSTYDPIADINRDSKNLYDYCKNGPFINWDKRGLLTIVVHGTNAQNEEWYKNGTFIDALDAKLHDVWKVTSTNKVAKLPKEFSWNGKNSDKARRDAGDSLAKYIQDVKCKYPSEKINLIGHSHGGNVILTALLKLANITKNPYKVDNVVLIGTPHILLSDSKRTALRYWSSNIKNAVNGSIYNLYSIEDDVQTTVASTFDGLDDDDLKSEKLPTKNKQVVRWLAISYIHNIPIPTDVGWYDAHGVLHGQKMGNYVADLILGNITDIPSIGEKEENDKGNPIPEPKIRRNRPSPSALKSTLIIR